ncbi:MAG: DinB family protein [Dehalococcoidia bacterium]
MHPFADSAHAVLGRALDDLVNAAQDLPTEALDWRPAEDENSITVLVHHSLSACRFLVGWAAGSAPDRAAYMAGERADAFRTAGTGAAGLLSAISAFRGELPALLAKVSDASLAAKATWQWPDGGTPDGAELLIHSIGHVREHAGHAGLTRNLWLAGQPR